MPETAPTTPRVLGVDEFALRKGHVYATVLVDIETRSTGRLADRVREHHAAVHALIDDGVALRAIADRLGLARNTVRRLARPTDPDELLVGRWTGCASILDPYKPHIDQRFAQGLTNARRRGPRAHRARVARRRTD